MAAVDPTRTKILRDEFARELKKLPRSANSKILAIIESSYRIDENTINEIKEVVRRELGPEAAEKIVERYTMLFWQRGTNFAQKQLKKRGIEIVIPSRFFVLDEETLTQLENLQLDLIKGLKDETKKQIAFQLRDGIVRGESIRQLSERVKKIIDDSKWKAERIARTESTRVFNTAAINRYQKAGVRKWRWLAAEDERTCPICGSKHGRIFKIGDPLPPAHPNCRCTVVPVLELPKRETVKLEITGKEEYDSKINEALRQFNKYLQAEGNHSRALNRLINGRVLSLNESEKLGKELYKKYIRGASKNLKPQLQTFLPLKVNPKLIESVGRVKITYAKSGRASYSFARRRIKLIRGYDESRGFLHEYGHHLENNENVRKAAQEFLRSRAKKKGYKFKPLKLFKEYQNIARWDEYAFAGFEHIDPYMGKIYPGKNLDEYYEILRKLQKNPKLIEEVDFRTEIISMGLERMRNPESIKDFAEKDPELFGFILAVLKGDFI